MLATPRPVGDRIAENFFALLLAIGGSLGAITIIRANLAVIATQGLAAVLAGILVGLFAMAIWVGVQLWRGSPRAWRWAVVLFALQVPVVTTRAVSFNYFTGVAVTLMNLSISGWRLSTSWGFRLGAGGSLSLNDSAANAGIGINLFALVAAAFLLQRGFAGRRSAELSGQRAYSHPMTRPWSAIVTHYSTYPGDRRSIRALGTLAERISASALSKSLFAWTSMFDLCITRTEVMYPYNGPKLRITSVSKDLLEFRYEDSPDGTREWQRTVDANDAWTCFLDFLDRLRWSSPEKIVSSDSAVHHP